MNELFLDMRRAAKVRPSQHHGKPPKIEKNVPLPVETRGGANNNSHFYPLEKMKPGDSFWVPAGDGNNCTAGAVSKFAKKSGWKFVTRSQSHDGRANNKVGKELRGTRVWRIS